jgi:hypothetical protein
MLRFPNFTRYRMHGYSLRVAVSITVNRFLGILNSYKRIVGGYGSIIVYAMNFTVRVV